MISPEQPSQIHPILYEDLLACATPDARYVRTESAQKLVDAFATANLALAYDARLILTTENASRYGNAYAWMTRELSKHISGRRQRIVEEHDLEWSGEVHNYMPRPLDWSNLDYTGEAGADLVINIIKQVEARNERGGEKPSDIPVNTANTTLMREGCKDVETYFAQSLQNDKLEQKAVGGKQFWQKKLGAKTYLNLEPIEYDGIEVPPGCVFRREENGGFTFLRVTGLAFEQPKAEELFGGSITDWYEAKGGKRDTAELFAAFSEARDHIAAEQSV